MIRAAPLLLLAASSTAWATSGPWVLGRGERSIYLGFESQRLTRLAVTVDGERSVIDVDQGLSTVGAKLIGSFGLASRLEVEGALPVYRVHANRTDGEVCAALGPESCDTTTTLGIVSIRAKGLLLDELFGPPLSLTAGVELRWGDFTAPTRARITNVGEGTFDAGAFVAAGRSGSLGKGYWSGFAEVGARYRLPKTRAYPTPDSGTLRAPREELYGQVQVALSPDPRVGFGPTANLFWRPGGLDWGELDLTDIDRLSALKVLSVRAGAELYLREPRTGTTLSLGVAGTVWAENNPTDVWVVSAGLSINQAPKAEE